MKLCFNATHETKWILSPKVKLMVRRLALFLHPGRTQVRARGVFFFFFRGARGGGGVVCPQPSVLFVKKRKEKESVLTNQTILNCSELTRRLKVKMTTHRIKTFVLSRCFFAAYFGVFQLNLFEFLFWNFWRSVNSYQKI